MLDMWAKHCRARSVVWCGCLTRSYERSAEICGVRSGSKAGIGCSAPQGTDFDDYLKI
jgi:hypothetical protein